MVFFKLNNESTISIIIQHGLKSKELEGLVLLLDSFINAKQQLFFYIGQDIDLQYVKVLQHYCNTHSYTYQINHI